MAINFNIENYYLIWRFFMCDPGNTRNHIHSVIAILIDVNADSKFGRIKNVTTVILNLFHTYKRL